MAGERTVTKPSRSDEVLDSKQQLQITDQVRAQFEAIAPKRPTKPNRSESDTTIPPTPSPYHAADPHNIPPELDRFRSLQQSQSHVVFSEKGGNLMEDDEFVETEYYKELDSLDKQHHTTGTGFIRVVLEDNCNGIGIGWVGDQGNGRVDGGTLVSGYRSNPATNDWVPSPEHHNKVYISSKPNRSENN